MTARRVDQWISGAPLESDRLLTAVTGMLALQPHYWDRAVYCHAGPR